MFRMQVNITHITNYNTYYIILIIARYLNINCGADSTPTDAVVGAFNAYLDASVVTPSGGVSVGYTYTHWL